MALARFGLPKQSRILTRSGFGSVFDGQCRVGDNWFTVFALPRESADLGPRLGLVVGRKVSPLAVTRNRIKRNIREAFRLTQHELTGMDFVVLARSTATEQPGNRLQTSLTRLLLKAHSKCAHSSSD